MIQAGGDDRTDIWLYHFDNDRILPSKAIFLIFRNFYSKAFVKTKKRPIGSLFLPDSEEILLGQAATLFKGELVFSGGGPVTIPAFRTQITGFGYNKDRKIIGHMLTPRKDHTMNSLTLGDEEVVVIYGGYERLTPSPKYSRQVFTKVNTVVSSNKATRFFF